MIPYGRQYIDDADKKAVNEVLGSDFLTQGEQVTGFEKDLCDYTGAKYCTAVNSATSALICAYKALGFGAGDILWTTPNTFVATSNSALLLGGSAHFIDIDLSTGNMSIEELEKELLQARENQTLPKIVCMVHYSGLSCDMKRVWELSKEYGFKLVEDASHAVGAVYNGSVVGSCEYSDACVFSFHPVKIMTTGEGGAVLTNSEEVYHLSQLACSHGVTKDKKFFKGSNTEPWYYEQIDIGYNFRMTDIHAVLGRSQLKKIEDFLKRRKELALRYEEAFKNLPLEITKVSSTNQSAWHLYPIRIRSDKASKKRLELFSILREASIYAQVHYIPVYNQPYYKNLGFQTGMCKNAEAFYDATLSLPMYYSLSNEEQDYVIKNVVDFFQ